MSEAEGNRNGPLKKKEKRQRQKPPGCNQISSCCPFVLRTVTAFYQPLTLLYTVPPRVSPPPRSLLSENLKITMWTTTAVSLPFPVSPTSLNNLGIYVRDVYRLRFAHELAAGALKPLVIPYSLLGTFILPVLYFCIPHVNRPWLFRARYLLMAFIVGFNLSETFGSSSANFAVAYAVGLMQAWGILWSATLLIWMSPQFEAERVERRRSSAGPVASPMALSGSSRRNRFENGHAIMNGHSPNGKAHDNLTSLNGAVDVKVRSQESEHRVSVLDAPDEDVARSLQEGYEYYWQAYPADAPFSVRFGWAFDLVSSFRGTGKRL